jgi:hypothetical protein
MPSRHLASKHGNGDVHVWGGLVAITPYASRCHAKTTYAIHVTTIFI